MKACVLTTIHGPNLEFIEKVSSLGYSLIVAGDLKTPPSWKKIPNVVYLDYQDQIKLFPKLGKLIPTNNYARKNFAYLYAIKENASTVWELDDDNYPQVNPESKLSGAPLYSTNEPWLNPYPLFYGKQIWPRGFPLNRVRESMVEITLEKFAPKSTLDYRDFLEDIHVVQFLANGNPDVDAICRLTNENFSEDMKSNFEGIIRLESKARSPMNTQNTLWLKREGFKFLFHPFSVNQRYSDIYKMYIAQTFCRVGLGGATVIQNRNPHDLFKDFIDELPMYSGVENLVRTLDSFKVNFSLTEVYVKLNELEMASKSDLLAAIAFEEYVDSM